MHARAPIAFLALALLLVLPGCGPEGTSTAGRPAPPQSRPGDPWLDDGVAQSGLPKLRLLLGAHTLDAELALTQPAIQKGMMWRTNVAETEAMLFVFARPHQTSFWMKNVPIDIDVAYLDPEGVIREIHRLRRFDTNPVPAVSPDIQFALETAEGWFARRGITPGVVVRTERGSLPESFFRSPPSR